MAGFEGDFTTWNGSKVSASCLIPCSKYLSKDPSLTHFRPISAAGIELSGFDLVFRPPSAEVSFNCMIPNIKVEELWLTKWV